LCRVQLHNVLVSAEQGEPSEAKSSQTHVFDVKPVDKIRSIAACSPAFMDRPAFQPCIALFGVGSDRLHGE
jgi:hypothetical protein